MNEIFEVGTQIVAVRDIDQALFGNYRATIAKGERGVVVSTGSQLLVKWGVGMQLYISAADVEPADPAPTATDTLQLLRARVQASDLQTWEYISAIEAALDEARRERDAAVKALEHLIDEATTLWQSIHW
jgi:hypothetical protein